MAGNSHKSIKGTGWRGVIVSPNAPAGGAGPGFSRDAGPLGVGPTSGGLPHSPPGGHPLSPAARLGSGSEASTSEGIEIEYGRSVVRSAVSEYTLGVLKDILRKAGLNTALITSTSRTPEDQARAMYHNLENQGVEKQKKLYGAAGDKVIDVYVQAKAAKKSQAQILAEMKDKIHELGPSRVSKHCRNGELLQVVDVAPSSIRLMDRFVTAVKSERRVANFLRPPLDPAYHLEIPQPEPPRAAEAPPPPPPPPPPKKKQKTWIEFQFVDDATGRPIPNVRFIVANPDGNENFQTTNSSGKVRIDDIEPGQCEAKSDLKGALLKQTLNFIGLGPPKSPPQDAGSGGEGPSGRLHVALIEPHKVKTGESLDRLAKDAGMSWQQLAKFNWGTDVPKKINEHLRDEVGCTKRTADGHNYVFDDSDEPGVVFIPKKWEQPSLATGQTHTVRMHHKSRFLIVLENEKGLRIPKADYKATLADGSVRKGKLGLGGVAAIEDPPAGNVSVEFTDLDDVEAKSLAACVRQGFDQHDMTDLYRMLKHPPVVIKMAFEAYDHYYNDYRGGGLKADIDEEITDPEAKMVVEALVRHSKATESAVSATEDQEA